MKFFCRRDGFQLSRHFQFVHGVPRPWMNPERRISFWDLSRLPIGAEHSTFLVNDHHDFSIARSRRGLLYVLAQSPMKFFGRRDSFQLSRHFELMQRVIRASMNLEVRKPSWNVGGLPIGAEHLAILVNDDADLHATCS